MEKNNCIQLVKRYAKILSICILSIFLWSCCASKQQQGDKAKQNQESPIDNSKKRPQNPLAPISLPDDIRQGTPYLGEVDGKTILLEFEKVSKKKYEGTYYFIDNQEEGKRERFSVAVQHKKLLAEFRQQQHTYTSVEIDASDGGFLFVGKEKKVQHTVRFSEYGVPGFRTFPNRYREEIFNYKIIKNVKYGTARGYWTDKKIPTEKYFKEIVDGIGKTTTERDLDLLMDLYLPADTSLDERPLILFIHGGAFYIGNKEDNPIVLWCKHYAAMGYVVASIDYRMGFRLTKQAIERCGYKATQDAHAAMRYLIHYKEKYKINPEYLFAAGSSAGGITALNLAFMRNENKPKSVSNDKNERRDLGDIETSGNAHTERFHIRGVVNMWGAVSDISMLGNSRTSIISFHGDADNIVPYGYDVPFQALKLGLNRTLFDKMYGSSAIHQKAKELGYREKLYTLKGCSHAPHVDKQNQPNQYFWFIQEKTTEFLAEELAGKIGSIRHKEGQVYSIDAPEYKELTWRIEGGIILKESGNQVRVYWFTDAAKHQLEVSGVLQNGTAVHDVYTK